ncbi:MAG: hypothetical protein KKF89_00475 [Nanoarchaeota archaeon]|nr:hypothetical protein [Nanoarchaeota archaeon]MBU1854171.1 hypothetical protein [Nanoarchaeota archaeon]
MAGFLLDLPIRIFSGLRMVYSEIIVWCIAIVLNVVIILTNVAVYENTLILSIFHHILSQPIPF